MIEFNNRIAAQRKILSVVNAAPWSEELFGLSHGALERWIENNRLSRSEPLVRLLHNAASKLFFLANKSQEQVTEEYKLHSAEVSRITAQIERAMHLSLTTSRNATGLS